jgi:hypothetical protein
VEYLLSESDDLYELYQCRANPIPEALFFKNKHRYDYYNQYKQQEEQYEMVNSDVEIDWAKEIQLENQELMVKLLFLLFNYFR